ncbi:MAG: selenocysteine-specific translation elongation factor [Verrucomicrobiales bacterium]|nr:selenocysteine-specific translation elongation factor [Verrucomicrobiales bacterium]
MIQPFIVATAGHVDHGKSALVRALTGTDPDRLPEEKARGITIDLGFAHHSFPAPPGNPHGATHYSCGIIDVPGHEDFVKNMVAGVGAIDLALLLVAADDGWMPQTEEHLQILTYLGIQSGVIVLSKADLTSCLPPLEAQIRSRLAGTPLANAPIVRVSALNGEGLPELSNVLAQVLANTPPPPDFGRPRLFVDRAFALRGIGTVVTGTLTGGSVNRGDALIVEPGHRTCRVRTCHIHGHEVERIPCGTRAGLNLTELEPRRDSTGPGTVGRGDVLTLPGLGAASDTLDVFLCRSPRPLRDDRPPSRPLVDGSTVNLLLGSAQVRARLLLLRGDRLGPGDTAIAQLRLEQPVFAMAQDRFILRDTSEQTTFAGGQVLDPEASRQNPRDPARLQLLDACAASPTTTDLLRLQLHRHPVGRIDSYLTRAKVSRSSALKAVGALIANQSAVQRGALLAATSAWRNWVEAAAQTIDQHHLQHPEQLGLALAPLRMAVAQELKTAAGEDALIHDLEQMGYVVEGTHIRRATHHPVLPPDLSSAGQRIRAALAQGMLDPPPRSAFLATGAESAALRFLIDAGEVLDLGSDIVLPLAAFLQARRKVREFLRRRESATTSEIRHFLGTTRRVVIPLLERFDRDGLTLREGDTRRLRTSALAGPATIPSREKPFAHGVNPRKTP